MTFTAGGKQAAPKFPPFPFRTNSWSKHGTRKPSGTATERLSGNHVMKLLDLTLNFTDNNICSSQ